MSDFSIAQGSNTPAVKFTMGTHTLLIQGKSYPEDARKFYDGLLTKVESFAKGKNFTIELDFEYLSSSSIACILDMLKHLKADSPSTNFRIKLYHEDGDDEMISVGENYEEISGIKVVFEVK